MTANKELSNFHCHSSIENFSLLKLLFIKRKMIVGTDVSGFVSNKSRQLNIRQWKWKSRLGCFCVRTWHIFSIRNQSEWWHVLFTCIGELIYLMVLPLVYPRQNNELLLELLHNPSRIVQKFGKICVTGIVKLGGWQHALQMCTHKNWDHNKIME